MLTMMGRLSDELMNDEGVGLWVMVGCEFGCWR